MQLSLLKLVTGPRKSSTKLEESIHSETLNLELALRASSLLYLNQTSSLK